MSRTVKEVDHDLEQRLIPRDLGRLRGEERPLGRLVDDLLDERIVLQQKAAKA